MSADINYVGSALAAPRPGPHCAHGHEFTPENTYRVPTGGRACRRCRQIRKAKYRAEKKATA